MLMSDDLESVVQAVVSQAKSDDMSAARIILERLAPVHKGRPVEIMSPGVV
jgi:hypothetical protein